jgi:hypothetical protein
MFASRIVLAVTLALSLAACHHDRCLSVCQQREKELDCKPETPERSCKATCDDLHKETPCSAAMRGWEACLVSLPANQWECNPAGQPVPKERACTDARAKVIDCITKFPQWPLPTK